MPESAGSLHCPNCGSPASPGDARCSYCKARLATVSCPNCFALMFDGGAFCPHCGARRDRAPGVDADARCPGCKGSMIRVQLGDVDMLECQQCDGTWVAAEMFDRMCASAEAQAAVLGRWQSAERAPAGAVRYRPCLVCGKMMNRLNFERVSGTVIDVCRGHGTFLDRGELHQIASFVQGGGLARARQRQIDDLKEEEDRLRAMQARVAQNLSVDASFSWDGGGVNLLALLDRLKKIDP
jgi:Zn-finger nucleic acid-binding protein